MFGKSTILLSVEYSGIQINLGKDLLSWWGVGKGEASQGG